MEEKSYESHKVDVNSLSDLDQFCLKMQQMAEMVDYLMNKSEDHENRLNIDNKRH